MQFLMGTGSKGIDFSRFETVTFNMRYPDRSPEHFKLDLMNFEPEMSTVGDWDTQRYNEAYILPAGQPSFTIPVNVLRTADWWAGERKVPPARSYSRLDNVTAVEIATASSEHGGVIMIELQSIQFRGKWISQTQLLMWLVSAWIGCGILGF
jgi:hypothetical protein